MSIEEYLEWLNSQAEESEEKKELQVRKGNYVVAAKCASRNDVWRQAAKKLQDVSSNAPTHEGLKKAVAIAKLYRDDAKGLADSRAEKGDLDSAGRWATYAGAYDHIAYVLELEIKNEGK